MSSNTPKTQPPIYCEVHDCNRLAACRGTVFDAEVVVCNHHRHKKDFVFVAELKQAGGPAKP